MSYVIRRTTVSGDYSYINRYLKNGDEFIIFVTRIEKKARFFDTIVDARDFMQPLIDGNHPTIAQYQIILVHDESPESAYDRAMGVI